MFENATAKLKELTWANYVEWETIKILSSEFNQHELPAIQLYDTGDVAAQLRGRTDNVLSFAVELVMVRNEGEDVDQGLLLDRRLEIKRKLGEDPGLGINTPASIGRFKNIQYVGGVTDLHSLSPHLMVRLDFQALYEEPFTSEC